jgi:fumarylacetoacetase
VDTQGRKLELGCLWEATETGTKSVMIVAEEDGKATGEPEVLQFLLDGDEIVLEGWCGDGKDGGWKLGFGECRGAIGPAATVLKGNEGESEKQLGVKVM